MGGEIAFRAIFSIVALFFLSSIFLHRESPLREYEWRWGYAARWATYRWAMLLFYCLTRNFNLYVQWGRWEIDMGACEAYLMKRQRRRAV